MACALTIRGARPEATRRSTCTPVSRASGGASRSVRDDTLPDFVSACAYAGRMLAQDAAWNEALAGWFFGERFAGRPVFLCVDEETLEVLGRESGIVASGAVESLSRAVRSRVRSGSPLDSWVRDATAWRQSGFAGPPPFVAILAVTVLAATMLGNPDDHSYYGRLNELLGLSGYGMPRDFDSDIHQLWSCLNEWLERVHRGGFGVATATNSLSSFPNMGWALSQTVLRPSDRAKLPFLFSALGVYAGQQVDGQSLLAGLRRSAMGGHGMSKRLADVLDQPALTDRLATTLASELARWDGTLRDESGRRAAELLLTFHQRSRAFGVAIKTPPDLVHLGLTVCGSAPVQLGEPGELQLLPLPVTASLLDGASMSAVLTGLSAEDHSSGDDHRRIRLVMPRRDLHLLVPNDGLARWVDVRVAEVHRRHLVVVRAGLARAAVDVMSSLSQTPPRRTPIPCPSGWLCYQFEPDRVRAIDGPLSVLSPRGTQVATLEGGLPISARARVFLSAGPPDLLLDLEAPDFMAAVDGQIVTEIVPFGRLRLADRGLAAGKHQIAVGGTHLTVRLVDEHAVGPASCSLAIALRAENSPAGKPWIVPAWTGAQDSPADDNRPRDVLLRGAYIELTQQTRLQHELDPARPSEARIGGRHYALGDQRVAVPVFPLAPAWLLELRPQPNPHMADLSSCASGLPFTPAWFLRIARDQATVVRGGARKLDHQFPDDEATGMSNEWDQILSWLPRATATPEQSAAWTAWLDEVLAPAQPGKGDAL